MWSKNRFERKTSSFSRGGPPSEEESLKRTLRHWGVDPDKNDIHRNFWNDSAQCLRDVRHGKLELEPSNSPQKLSENVHVAVQEVMKQELTSIQRKGNLLPEVTDHLEKQYPQLGFVGGPFEFDRNERQYRLKSQLQDHGIQPSDVDPFQRFTCDKMDAKQLLKKQYIDEEGHMNIFYRAIVAHQACLHARCASCYSDGSLRWNSYDHGGGDSQEGFQFRYWKKLVCMNCESVYEIKTALNQELIEKRLNGGALNGGNFYSAYHAIQKELRSHQHSGLGGKNEAPGRNARQYVAVLSRETSTTAEQGRYWPVHVAEVRNIAPQLKSRSFCRDEGQTVKIYSRMFFAKDAPGQFWFNVPYVELDSKSMAITTIEALPDGLPSTQEEVSS